MSASADHTFDIKSARLNLFSIRLRSTRLADITRDLDNRFSADSPFSRTPAMLDVSQVNPVELDYRGLVARFAQYGIHLVGVRPTPAGLEGALDDAGLLPLGGDEALDESRLEDEPQPQTLVIDKPVRAGQQVYARGGNLVVLATGFGSMNGWAADLISKEVADKVGKVWGLGSATTKDPGPWEGEQRNMWKPTQVENLWFHGGNLHQSRHYSRYLSLQLKARLEGIDTPVYALAESHHIE